MVSRCCSGKRANGRITALRVGSCAHDQSGASYVGVFGIRPIGKGKPTGQVDNPACSTHCGAPLRRRKELCAREGQLGAGGCHIAGQHARRVALRRQLGHQSGAHQARRACRAKHGPALNWAILPMLPRLFLLQKRCVRQSATYTTNSRLAKQNSKFSLLLFLLRPASL